MTPSAIAVRETHRPGYDPRRAPALVRVAAALALAQRCLVFAQLRRRPPMPPTNPLELYDQLGRRLPRTALLVYGVIRRAVYIGAAGALLSFEELAELVGSHARSCQRAVALLVDLELLRIVPQYHLVDGVMHRARNAYVLGAKARPPSERRRRKGRGRGDKRHQGGSDKTAKQQPSEASSLMRRSSRNGSPCTSARPTVDGRRVESVASGPLVLTHWQQFPWLPAPMDCVGHPKCYVDDRPSAQIVRGPAGPALSRADQVAGAGGDPSAPAPMPLASNEDVAAAVAALVAELDQELAEEARRPKAPLALPRRLPLRDRNPEAWETAQRVRRMDGEREFLAELAAAPGRPVRPDLVERARARHARRRGGGR